MINLIHWKKEISLSIFQAQQGFCLSPDFFFQTMIIKISNFQSWLVLSMQLINYLSFLSRLQGGKLLLFEKWIFYVLIFQKYHEYFLSNTSVKILVSLKNLALNLINALIIFLFTLNFSEFWRRKAFGLLFMQSESCWERTCDNRVSKGLVMCSRIFCV